MQPFQEMRDDRVIGIESKLEVSFSPDVGINDFLQFGLPLLGTDTDPRIAARLGLSPAAVKQARTSRGIPPYRQTSPRVKATWEERLAAIEERVKRLEGQ